MPVLHLFRPLFEFIAAVPLLHLLLPFLHIFVVVPKIVGNEMDWRLPVFECGRHLIAFDWAALEAQSAWGIVHGAGRQVKEMGGVIFLVNELWQRKMSRAGLVCNQAASGQ